MSSSGRYLNNILHNNGEVKGSEREIDILRRYRHRENIVKYNA